MKILVTGATGFIGGHVVQRLLDRNHEVVATGRSKTKAKEYPWIRNVQFKEVDISHIRESEIRGLSSVDAVVHLAWDKVQDCASLFHINEALHQQYFFLKRLVECGVRQLLVAGTCFEYGLQNGCLSEEMSTFPVTTYGLAKDTLRKFLQMFQMDTLFTLQWLRLFYIYGTGQHRNSVLAQLDSAIDRKDSVFNMSGGEQLRDYLPVEEVAVRISAMIERGELDGIYNCCSGIPISLRNLIEKRIAERESSITLNLGFYPYRDYEPMAFWGNGGKMMKATIK